MIANFKIQSESQTVLSLLTLAAVLATGCEYALHTPPPDTVTGSARVQLLPLGDGMFVAELDLPDHEFRFSAPSSEDCQIIPREAVLVTKRKKATGLLLQAELHRVIGECSRCGDFEVRPDPPGILQCPGCESRLSYSLCPKRSGNGRVD